MRYIYIYSGWNFQTTSDVRGPKFIKSMVILFTNDYYYAQKICYTLHK